MDCRTVGRHTSANIDHMLSAVMRQPQRHWHQRMYIQSSFNFFGSIWSNFNHMDKGTCSPISIEISQVVLKMFKIILSYFVSLSYPMKRIWSISNILLWEKIMKILFWWYTICIFIWTEQHSMKRSRLSKSLQFTTEQD